MTDTRQIHAVDVLDMAAPVEIDRRIIVRFPVRPPTAITASDQTPPGARVRLVDDEGVIDVVLTDDGAIEVRGRHALRLDPIAANTVRLALRDADERDDDAQPLDVLEGWWHPNVNAGRVHDHPDVPGRSWSQATHRLCEGVFTKRAPQ